MLMWRCASVYKLEVFTDQMQFASAAVISAPEISLDYLTYDAYSLTVPTMECKKGWYTHISNDGDTVADGVVSDVQPGKGVVDISIRPLQAIFDVQVFPSPITDAAAWLAEQIRAQFVSNADTLQNRPIHIESAVRSNYPLEMGEGDTIGLIDVMAQALTTYGIYVDAKLDFDGEQIAVQILPPPAAVTLEADLDNVLERSITLGDSYGSANKMIIRKRVTDSETDAVSYPMQAVFYLHPNGSVDTNNADRISPVFWAIATLPDSETWDADALEQATQTLAPQQYDNEIILKFALGDKLVEPESIQPGTPVTIYTGGLPYNSILTGRAFSAGTIELTFGAVRVALTKQLILQRRQA